MRSSVSKVFFDKCVFDILGEVYEPAEDSFLFANNLNVKPGISVVDVGTGCGILGIMAAMKGARVLGIDINLVAVQCSKHNADKNGVAEATSFLRGDLLSSVRRGLKFDQVLFNAPYLPSDDVHEYSGIDLAWSGGARGRYVIDEFIPQAADHLETDGEILLMQSNLSDIEETLRAFARENFDAKIIVHQDVPFFETLVLIKACERAN